MGKLLGVFSQGAGEEALVKANADSLKVKADVPATGWISY